jgi:hypothetical protein
VNALVFVIFISPSWGQNNTTTTYENTHVFTKNGTMASKTVFITPAVPVNNTSYQSMANSTIYSSLRFKSAKSSNTDSSPKTLSAGKVAGILVGILVLLCLISICSGIHQLKKDKTKPTGYIETYTSDVWRPH